jgi:hypothetical protein
MAIWHVVHVVIWYIFTRFGMLYDKKSGNPELGVCWMIARTVLRMWNNESLMAIKNFLLGIVLLSSPPASEGTGDMGREI